MYDEASPFGFDGGYDIIAFCFTLLYVCLSLHALSLSLFGYPPLHTGSCPGHDTPDHVLSVSFFFSRSFLTYLFSLAVMYTTGELSDRFGIF